MLAFVSLTLEVCDKIKISHTNNSVCDTLSPGWGALVLSVFFPSPSMSVSTHTRLLDLHLKLCSWAPGLGRAHFYPKPWGGRDRQSLSLRPTILVYSSVLGQSTEKNNNKTIAVEFCLCVVHQMSINFILCCIVLTFSSHMCHVLDDKLGRS